MREETEPPRGCGVRVCVSVRMWRVRACGVSRYSSKRPCVQKCWTTAVALGTMDGRGPVPFYPVGRGVRFINLLDDGLPTPAARFDMESFSSSSQTLFASKEFYQNRLAQHWARDWRALALTHRKNFSPRKNPTREDNRVRVSLTHSHSHADNPYRSQQVNFVPAESRCSCLQGILDRGVRGCGC